jgi:hypothetical protein
VFRVWCLVFGGLAFQMLITKHQIQNTKHQLQSVISAPNPAIQTDHVNYFVAKPHDQLVPVS